MKKFYSCLIWLAIVFFVGCATTAKYENKLLYWIGKSEEELVTAWGIPTSTYLLDSKKLLMYRQDFGASSTAQPVAGTYYVNTVNNWCETTFTLSESKVVKFQLNGTSCVSY